MPSKSSAHFVPCQFKSGPDSEHDLLGLNFRIVIALEQNLAAAIVPAKSLLKHVLSEISSPRGTYVNIHVTNCMGGREFSTYVEAQMKYVQNFMEHRLASQDLSSQTCAGPRCI
jgi:hypothetical protein